MKQLIFCLTLFLLCTSCLWTCAAEPENLLRNGSFEGGLLYWHGIKSEHHRLVKGHAAAGSHKLRIEKGYVMSAPFVVERGKTFTVSFFARGDRAGTVNVQLPPSAREVGQKSKRLWSREASQQVQVTTEWQRFSVTARADVPPSGFWPNPHYMVLIGARSASPVEVDGVTVLMGDRGSEQYVPRREVEVVADCPDLPGYVEHGNLFDKGAEVRLTAHLSNPGSASRDVTIRWQLYDYEGTRAIGAPMEKQVTIPAGATLSETAALELVETGCVLARISAASGDNILDSIDFPLTSLPYPKAATRPDWRERFGGSFAGGIQCVKKFQKIGFGWIRWRPHMNGQDHWPEKDAPWQWFDKELDEQEAHGCSTHCVLHPPPAWIMEKGHPLPKDMRWPAEDPRWDDLDIETVWDRFVRTAVEHYKGRSLVYEIQNEPDLGSWDRHKKEYVKFTIRTARLIRQTDPQAKIMINNVYGIPSGLNRLLLEGGVAQYIDIISWHDYHAGWLTDAAGIRRMRSQIDAYGGEHVEIWFNEGWAFTNTAVDEPPACTGLTCAQSVNAIMDSVAELTVAGQEKTILFHTAYESHGMSFWDYSGPGTMLWDWYDFPLPLVAAWNTLTHHIGLSEEIGLVRPGGANFCIFQDSRNGRGVMVAYADRGATSDVTVALPFPGLVAEDIMGNAAPLGGDHLTLSKTGRPVLLYDAGRTPGRTFYDKLEPLDRKHASFVSTAGEAEVTYSLPPTWIGQANGSSDGNPAQADGQPLWRLDQVWPPNPKQTENYRPLVWDKGWWKAPTNDFGGQPKAEMKNGAIRLEFRAAHGKPQAPRLCSLSFIAPREGQYTIRGQALHRLWEGNNTVQLMLLLKTKSSMREAGGIRLSKGETPIPSMSANLGAGDELVFAPWIEGHFSGGEVTLQNLQISMGGDAPAGAEVYRLPNTWKGSETGASDGNPVWADAKPIWRLDRLYPDNPIMSENYQPLVWGHERWEAPDHKQGGNPSVRVMDGRVRFGAMGKWSGGYEYQKIPVLAFIAPAPGIYRVAGRAHAKPWTGGAKHYRLGFYKRDTQRAAELKQLLLLRDASPMVFDVTVELTGGHELLLLPLMPDWNNGVAITVEDLTITRME